MQKGETMSFQVDWFTCSNVSQTVAEKSLEGGGERGELRGLTIDNVKLKDVK